MTEKQFWCIEGYEGETSPIVDGKFAPTNGWLCDKLNELNEEKEQLTQENKDLKEQREELFIRERDTKNELRELKKENKKLIAALKEHKDDTIFSDDKKQVMEREREIHQDRKMPGWMKSGRFA